MICLSSTLVKPELLIKSFFSFPKFSKAELAVLRFQREYTVNVTEKKGQCATKIRKKNISKHKKKTPAVTDTTWELLLWHKIFEIVLC